MAVGILALQGAFAEHAAVLDKLGVPHFEIRQKRDLDQPMNGLIIPGGESTVLRDGGRSKDADSGDRLHLRCQRQCNPDV